MVAEPAASGVAASMAMSRAEVFRPGVGMKPAAAVMVHENELGGRSQETGKVSVDRSFDSFTLLPGTGVTPIVPSAGSSAIDLHFFGSMDS